MSESSGKLTQDQAQRLLKRAAELQTASPDPSLRGEAVAHGADSGYEVGQLREAAAEVGIGPEFFAAALAETDAPSGGSGDPAGLLATTFRGAASPAPLATRRFERPVHEVYAGLARVLERHHLALLHSGGDPLSGDRSVYVLSVRGAASDGTSPPIAEGWEQLRELSVRLLPLDEKRCVATLSSSPDHSGRASLGAAAALTGGSGVFGGWAVGGLSAALMLTLPVGGAIAAAAIGGAILVGAGAGATAAIAGSRAAFRSAQKRRAATLERLLQLVDTEVRRLPSQAPAPKALPDSPGSVP